MASRLNCIARLCKTKKDEGRRADLDGLDQQIIVRFVSFYLGTYPVFFLFASFYSLIALHIPANLD
jgi:hypothetical protein